MVDSIDDVARQARQGSVAAVIQVLNDQLADGGVRTRAVFADGVLQLLCEAPTEAQLEQSTLVKRVKHILESLAPRNIRRVRINSRIVREQQLLWLDEISRDPDSQLLWSELVTLARPNPIKRWIDDFNQTRSADSKFLPKSLSSQKVREKQQFWRGLLGGAGLSVLLLLVAAGIWQQLAARNTSRVEAEAPRSPQPTTPTTVARSPQPVASPPASLKASDPFAEAVRLAEQASDSGKTAKSSADWLALAAKWQQASDLMSQVAAEDQRYSTAQNRAVMYRQNSQSALQKVETPTP